MYLVPGNDWISPPPKKIVQKYYRSAPQNKWFPAVFIKLQKYLLILIIAVFTEYLPSAAFVNIALC